MKHVCVSILLDRCIPSLTIESNRMFEGPIWPLCIDSAQPQVQLCCTNHVRVKLRLRSLHICAFLENGPVRFLQIKLFWLNSQVLINTIGFETTHTKKHNSDYENLIFTTTENIVFFCVGITATRVTMCFAFFLNSFFFFDKGKLKMINTCCGLIIWVQQSHIHRYIGRL